MIEGLVKSLMTASQNKKWKSLRFRLDLKNGNCYQKSYSFVHYLYMYMYLWRLFENFESIGKAVSDFVRTFLPDYKKQSFEKNTFKVFGADYTELKNTAIFEIYSYLRSYLPHYLQILGEYSKIFIHMQIFLKFTSGYMITP